MQGDGEKRKASPQTDAKSRGAATAKRTHDAQSKNGNRYKAEDSMGENRPKTKIKNVAVAKQSLYPGTRLGSVASSSVKQKLLYHLSFFSIHLTSTPNITF